jgi:hypothetical protein
MKEAVARKRAELAARDARILTLNQVCVIYIYNAAFLTVCLL